MLRELPLLDERPFFEAALREPLLFARVLVARVLEPDAVRLERTRFDAAVVRLEFEERFDADDPPLLLGLLVRVLGLCCCCSSIVRSTSVLVLLGHRKPSFPGVCRRLPVAQRRTHAATARPP